MKNPFEDLAITISFHGGGIANATTVAAPALASEVVKATFYGLLQMGFHIDSVLDEYEDIVEQFRGFEMTGLGEIDPDPDGGEPV